MLRIAALCITLITTLLCGCGPSRTVILPGEIPSAPHVSPEDERYGQAVLAEISRQYPLSLNDTQINLIRDIVARLARTARADQAPWNVYVLEGESVVNAAATRGNYVFVWTGLIRVSASEGELATVLSHELGHLLAGHTQPTPAEEASSIIAQTTGQVAGQIIATQGAYGVLAGITSTLVTEAIKALAVNPESQRQELEADHIGFFLMSDAGYDPDEALAFWQRLASAASGGGGTLQVLSSHPANDERLAELRRLLPEATARYARARGASRNNREALQQRLDSSHDSFSFGNESNAATHLGQSGNQSKPGHIRHHYSQLNVWQVVEPMTPVMLTPFADASRVTTLKAGTEVLLVGRVGRFYEIRAPVQGFVQGEKLSPKVTELAPRGRP
jgi:predicted Zn-dependent protease